MDFELDIDPLNTMNIFDDSIGLSDAMLAGIDSKPTMPLLYPSGDEVADLLAPNNGISNILLPVQSVPCT